MNSAPPRGSEGGSTNARACHPPSSTDSLSQQQLQQLYQQLHHSRSRNSSSSSSLSASATPIGGMSGNATTPTPSSLRGTPIPLTPQSLQATEYLSTLSALGQPLPPSLSSLGSSASQPIFSTSAAISTSQPSSDWLAANGSPGTNASTAALAAWWQHLLAAGTANPLSQHLQPQHPQPSPTAATSSGFSIPSSPVAVTTATSLAPPPHSLHSTNPLLGFSSLSQHQHQIAAMQYAAAAQYMAALQDQATLSASMSLLGSGAGAAAIAAAAASKNPLFPHGNPLLNNMIPSDWSSMSPAAVSASASFEEVFQKTKELLHSNSPSSSQEYLNLKKKESTKDNLSSSHVLPSQYPRDINGGKKYHNHDQNRHSAQSTSRNNEDLSKAPLPSPLSTRDGKLSSSFKPSYSSPSPSSASSSSQFSNKQKSFPPPPPPPSHHHSLMHTSPSRKDKSKNSSTLHPNANEQKTYSSRDKHLQQLYHSSGTGDLRLSKHYSPRSHNQITTTTVTTTITSPSSISTDSLSFHKPYVDHTSGASSSMSPKSPIKTAGTFLPPVCQTPSNLSAKSYSSAKITKHSNSTSVSDFPVSLLSSSLPLSSSHQELAFQHYQQQSVLAKHELKKSALAQKGKHSINSVQSLSNNPNDLAVTNPSSSYLSTDHSMSRVALDLNYDQPLNLCMSKRRAADDMAEDLSLTNNLNESDDGEKSLVLPPAIKSPIGSPTDLPNHGESTLHRSIPPFGGLGYLYPPTTSSSSNARNTKHKKTYRRLTSSPTGSTSSSSSTSSMTHKSGPAIKQKKKSPLCKAHGSDHFQAPFTAWAAKEFSNSNLDSSDYKQLADTFLQLENSMYNQNQQTMQTTVQSTAALLAAAATKKLPDQSLDPKWHLLQGIIESQLKQSTYNVSTKCSEQTKLPNERDGTPSCESAIAEYSTGCSESEDDDSSSEVDTNGTRIDGSQTMQKRGSSYVDEKLICKPLMKGWQRESLITSLAQNGIAKGDVCYITPCEQRLHSYAEVLKYLSRSNIQDLNRSNFSFNPKNLLGTFFINHANTEVLSLLKVETEGKVGQSREGKYPGLIILRADEMRRKIIEMTLGRGRYAQRLIKNSPNFLGTSYSKLYLEPSENTQNTTLQNMPHQYQQNLSHNAKPYLQETAKTESAAKLTPSFMSSFQQHLQKLKNAPETKSLKPEPNYQHIQQLQQQAAEEKERQRKQELMLKIQERERKRKELIVFKFLEIRRKQEEKDKLRVDKRRTELEMKALKVRLRGIEVELSQELTMLKEDMVLESQSLKRKSLARDSHQSLNNKILGNELPCLERIQGLRLSEEAFADMLMVIEFLNNFHEILGLQPNNIIGMKTFQRGLFYEDLQSADEVDNLLMHLLQIAMDEPGLPNPRDATTILGQKITDVPLDDISMSEISRIFIRTRNGYSDNRITKALQKQPFQAMTPELKAQVMAFICNELLMNKNIVKQIDGNLDAMANCRKEKWLLDNDMKKYIRIKRMKFSREEKGTGFEEEEEEDFDEENDDGPLVDDDGESQDMEEANDEDESLKNKKKTKKKKKDFEDEDVDGDDAAVCQKGISNYSQKRAHSNFDNFGISNIPIEQDEAFQLDLEQLDKRISRTEKQLAKNSTKFFNTSKSIRGLDLGMDRYKRRYWALSHCGGLFVQACDKEDAKVEEIVNDLAQGDLDQKVIDLKDNSVQQIIPETETFEAYDSDEPDEVWVGLANTQICKSNVINYKTESESSEIEIDLDRKNGQTCIKSVDTSTIADEQVEPFNQSLNQNSESLPPQWWQTASAFFDFLAPEAVSYKKEENDDNLEIEGTKLMIDSKSKLLHQIRQTEVMETPSQYKDGWWIARQPETVKLLIERSFASGMRENPLQRNLANFYDNHLELCLKPKYRQTVDFELTSTDDFSCPALPTTLKKSFGLGKKRKYDDEADNEECSKRARTFYADIDHHDPACYFSPALSHQMEVQLLHEVEALEERIFAANIQIGDLKAMTSITAKIWQSKVTRKNSSSESSDTALEPKHPNNEEAIIKSTDDDPSDLIEKAMKNDIPLSCDIRKAPLGVILTIENPLEKAKEKLLLLERCIERRYLKPPLRKNLELTVHSVYQMNHENQVTISSEESSETNESGRNTPSHNNGKVSSSPKISTEGNAEDEDEELEEDETRGLRRWRNATSSAESVSQVGLCLNQLTQCIAWEKSIMRASCQLCHLDDNEAQLLLCDSCDKGFHTYCFKPTMENIPEGNWYCFICIGKAMGETVCVVCGKKSTLHLLRCELCLLSFHGDCLDPPLTKVPRGRWNCNHCAQILKYSPSKKTSNVLGVSKKANSPLQQQLQQTVIKTHTQSQIVTLPDVPSKKCDHFSDNSRSARQCLLEPPETDETCVPIQVHKHTQITNNHESQTVSSAIEKSSIERSSLRLQDQQQNKHLGNQPLLSENMKESNGSPSSVSTIGISPTISASSSTQTLSHQPLINIVKTSLPSSSPTGISCSTHRVVGPVQRLRSCKQLLSELKSHAAGWPFLQPVNLKAFPQYKKIIKTPMDFSLIERRISAALNVACADQGDGAASVTQAHVRFAADILLVFKNCLTFNEDNSEVGKAGKTLEKYFRKRWKEIFGKDVDEDTK